MIIIGHHIGLFMDKVLLKLRLRERTIDDHIADAIRQWPTLFGNRDDVLHHWFCVNGNGMEWMNGELIQPYRGTRDGSELRDENQQLLENARYLSISDHNDEASRKYQRRSEARIRIRTREENSKIRFNRKNAHLLALVGYSYDKKRSIYPLCQYACMCEVPDDVKPEWLAAVRETIFMVFKAPLRKPDHQFTQEQREQEQKNNLQVASTVLTNLANRFGGDGPKTYEEWYARNTNNFQLVMNALKPLTAVSGTASTEIGATD